MRPDSLPKAEGAFAFGNLTAWDTALGWRYPNPQMKNRYGTHSMGETAENIAQERPHLTREKQDAFAVRSHQRAIAAIDSGKFAEEILAVPVPQRKGELLQVKTDERPRRDTSMESLGRLKPAFREDGGTVTAGNSSGLNDGAAALLLMSDDRARAIRFQTSCAHRRLRSSGCPAARYGLWPDPCHAQGPGTRGPEAAGHWPCGTE